MARGFCRNRAAAASKHPSTQGHPHGRADGLGYCTAGPPGMCERMQVTRIARVHSLGHAPLGPPTMPHGPPGPGQTLSSALEWTATLERERASLRKAHMLEWPASLALLSPIPPPARPGSVWGGWGRGTTRLSYMSVPPPSSRVNHCSSALGDRIATCRASSLAALPSCMARATRYQVAARAHGAVSPVSCHRATAGLIQASCDRPHLLLMISVRGDESASKILGLRFDDDWPGLLG